MGNVREKIILGSFIHSPNRGKVEILKNALLLINADGKVIELIESSESRYSSILNESKSSNALYEISSH